MHAGARDGEGDTRSHIYREVKPTSRRDRDLNRLGADLGTSHKRFNGPFMQMARALRPPPLHSLNLKEWRQTIYLYWLSHSSTSKVELNLNHSLARTFKIYYNF
jgi:hypothetical protein